MDSDLDKLEKELKDTKVEKPAKDYRNSFHKYAELESQFQPDDMVFKYVWAFLYTTYIISFLSSKSSTGSFVSLLIGLILNISWIAVFLIFKSPTPSLIVLSLMLIFAVDSVFRLFKAKKRVQGVFISIYLAWLMFAFYLNFIITKNYYLTFPLDDMADMGMGKGMGMGMKIRKEM